MEGSCFVHDTLNGDKLFESESKINELDEDLYISMTNVYEGGMAITSLYNNFEFRLKTYTEYMTICSNGCYTCTYQNFEYCTRCAPGKDLYNGNCYTCDDTCKTCSGTGPNSCLTCM